MTKSKKIVLAVIIIISLVVLSLIGYTLYFYFSTENYENVIKNLNSKSENKTSNFQSIDQAIVSTKGDYDYNKYIFFINNTKTENQIQEMAIYQKKCFLFTNWCRYVVVHDTIGTVKEADEPVGVLTTSLERDSGIESRVCIFYSDNNSDKQICRTEYTLYDASTELGTYTDEEAGGDIYLFIVDHLGEEAIGQYISLPNAKFYDSESNLIYEYVH